MSDGQHVAIHIAQVLKRLAQLVHGFTESDHYAGLGEEGRSQFLDDAEDFERAAVFALWSDRRRKAFDHLEVVVVKFRARGTKGLDAVTAGVEVGGENFDGGIGAAIVDGGNASGEVAGAFVFQVVPGDCGNDDVCEVQLGDGIREPIGFISGRGVRSSSGDGTIMAPASALVAEDHEGGVTFGPAFRQVGAFGFLADGGDPAGGHHFSGMGEIT